MRDPGAVEALRGLALLVLPHLRERDRVHLGVAARGDERRHPAHRERAAPVARLDEQLAVRAHERHGHRHGRAVGEHELGPVPELLDDAEDVVPAAGVEARPSARAARERISSISNAARIVSIRTVALIVPARDAEPVLRPDEDVVPEPRLEVRLELREVEVAAVAAVVAEEVEPEVEQRARHRRAVDLEVALLEVPAARADEQHGDLVAELVPLLARVERDRPVERVRQVPLAVDAVLPGRRVRVLEVGHEDLRARS